MRKDDNAILTYNYESFVAIVFNVHPFSSWNLEDFIFDYKLNYFFDSIVVSICCISFYGFLGE